MARRGKNFNDLEMLTINEFCRLTKISVSTFYALRAKKAAPRTIKIGRSVRIRMRDALRWLKKARLESFD